jgi:hypothetical protein
MEELLKKYMKNEFNTHFEQKLTTGSCGVGIGHAWYSRKLVKYVVHLSKRKKEKENIYLHTSYPNNNRLVFGPKEF